MSSEKKPQFYNSVVSAVKVEYGERFLRENTKDHKVLYESLEQLRTQLEGYGFEVVEEKDLGLGESAVIKMRKKNLN